MLPPEVLEAKMCLPKVEDAMRGSRQHDKLQPGTATVHHLARRRRRKFSPMTRFACQKARFEHDFIESLHASMQPPRRGQQARRLTIFISIFLTPRSDQQR